MHQNAHTARTKNAAVENANLGGLESHKNATNLGMQLTQNALLMHKNALACAQIHENALSNKLHRFE